MCCETIQIQAYIDRQLSAEETRAVETHLAWCAACRQELALLRRVDDALRAWPVQPEANDLTARIMAQVRVEQAAERRSALSTFRMGWDGLLLSFFLALALTALLSGLLWLLPDGASLWRTLAGPVWTTIQAHPAHATWSLLSLSTVIAAVAGAVVLVTRWPMPGPDA